METIGLGQRMIGSSECSSLSYLICKLTKNSVRVAEDIERVLAKEPSSPSGTSRKRARLATESGTNGVSSKNPIIKSEEDMTSAGNIRELRPPPLQHSSTQRPAQTSDYRTPHPETSRYGGDVGLARQPPANLGSHAVTNGSKGGPKGPSYSRPKARRDYLEDVCAFELKGQPCQMPEGCFKKNVCVVRTIALKPLIIFVNKLTQFHKALLQGQTMF